MKGIGDKRAGFGPDAADRVRWAFHLWEQEGKPTEGESESLLNDLLAAEIADACQGAARASAAKMLELFGAKEEAAFEIRPELQESLDEYARVGCPTGDFLRAVLANDLMQALGQADAGNRTGIFGICAYIHNTLPAACHGSPEKVAAWLKMHADARKGGAG